MTQCWMEVAESDTNQKKIENHCAELRVNKKNNNNKIGDPRDWKKILILTTYQTICKRWYLEEYINIKNLFCTWKHSRLSRWKKKMSALLMWMSF